MQRGQRRSRRSGDARAWPCRRASHAPRAARSDQQTTSSSREAAEETTARRDTRRVKRVGPSASTAPVRGRASRPNRPSSAAAAFRQSGATLAAACERAGDKGSWPWTGMRVERDVRPTWWAGPTCEVSERVGGLRERLSEAGRCRVADCARVSAVRACGASGSRSGPSGSIVARERSPNGLGRAEQRH